MTNTDWHVAAPLLARFADSPMSLDDTAAASVEAHLVACAECREQLRRNADPAQLAQSWDAVADRVDRNAVGLVERLLDRLGLHAGSSRLVAATPALRLAGLVSIAVVAAGATLASRAADAEGPFLVLAPLAPLAAVAASFAPAADPAGEAGVATPMWGPGLVLRRALAVLTVTFGLLAMASLALPGLGARSATWVLPALGLSFGVLALATWIRVEVAMASLAVLWLGLVFSGRWLTDHDAPFVDAATFEQGGQLVSLTVALVAVAVIHVRRGRFSTLEAFR